MKKNILFSLLIFFGNLFFSQSQKKSLLYFSNGFGIAEITKEKEYKINAHNYSFCLGREFSVKTSKFLIGIGVDKFYADISQNAHLNSLFVNIPLGIRFYAPRDSNSSLYTSVGIYNKYKLYEKISNEFSQSSLKGERGYHLGAFGEMGYKMRIADRLDGMLGLHVSGDLLQAGYNHKTKLNNIINFTFSLNVFNKQE